MVSKIRQSIENGTLNFNDDEKGTSIFKDEAAMRSTLMTSVPYSADSIAKILRKLKKDPTNITVKDVNDMKAFVDIVEYLNEKREEKA